MELNTEFHQRSRCCFALHKTLLNLVQRATDGGVFGHRSLQNCRSSPFSAYL